MVIIWSIGKKKKERQRNIFNQWKEFNFDDHYRSVKKDFILMNGSMNLLSANEHMATVRKVDEKYHTHAAIKHLLKIFTCEKTDVLYWLGCSINWIKFREKEQNLKEK